MTPLRRIGAVLFAAAGAAVPLFLLALPTCIVYWWVGMSGDLALAIDIGGTALIIAGFVTVAYYAD